MTNFPFEFWHVATGMAFGALGTAVAAIYRLCRRVASLETGLQAEKHQHRLTKVTLHGLQNENRQLKRALDEERERTGKVTSPAERRVMPKPQDASYPDPNDEDFFAELPFDALETEAVPRSAKVFVRT